jgi:hypothetical protein
VSDSGFIAIGNDWSCCMIFLGGGSIISWHVDGQAMLRATALARLDPGTPLETASFSLAPHSNRIGHSRFRWAGKDHLLTPNFAPEAHAVHGVGWQRRWQLISSLTFPQPSFPKSTIGRMSLICRGSGPVRVARMCARQQRGSGTADLRADRHERNQRRGRSVRAERVAAVRLTRKSTPNPPDQTRRTPCLSAPWPHG